MKKFQFAAGLMALAMLGACSSDAPEVVGGGEADNTEGLMYLSVNIKGAEGTRAQTASQDGAPSFESDIKALDIVIYDNNENVVLWAHTTEFGEKTAQGAIPATFAIPSHDFNNLKTFYEGQVKDAEGNFDEDKTDYTRIIVVANAGSDLTGVNVIHSSYPDPTWGLAGGSLATNGHLEIGSDPVFMMSNTAPCRAIMKPGDGHDGTTTVKAWEIASEISVGRLCTRFEYGSDNVADGYNPSFDKNLKMEVVGFGVHTFGQSVNYIPTFTSTGILPTTWTTDNHCHYTAEGTNNLRATAQITDENQLYYYSFDYSKCSKNAKFTYAHPNTLSSSYTWKTPETDNFKAVPYAAIKVKFTADNFGGTGSESVSMKNHDNVYAVGGVFIGGVEDFKALKAASKTFALDIDDNVITGEELENIKGVVGKYNGLNITQMPYYGATGELTATQKKEQDDWFVSQWNGIDTYKYDTDGYYTYYAKYIVHDKSKTALSEKYGVSRNVNYALAVSSIKLMGAPRDNKVGEGPKAAEFTNLYIDLSIKVQDWLFNGENTAWKL